jgi:nitric oxide reductase subunit B
MWYARSAEFLHQPIIETLVWLRVPGDIVFGAGGAVLAWFAFRLWRGRPQAPRAIPVRSAATRPAE